MKKPTDKMLVQAVITILNNHPGEGKRIKRVDLMRELRTYFNWTVRVSDREMRAAIETARSTPEGALICSTTANGGGYWMANHRGELDRYLSQDESRCLEMWNRIRKQRLAAGLALYDDVPEQLELL